MSTTPSRGGRSTSRDQPSSDRPSLLRAARDLLGVIGLRDRSPWLLLGVCAAWLVAAFELQSFVTIDSEELVRSGQSLWMDGHAYWAAWDGDLYGAAPRERDAYLYSPLFAQLLWPITLLPFFGFALVWWGALIGVFAWLLAPLPWVWRLPALVLTGNEVLVGNVHALLALALVLSLAHPAAWALPILTKVTPGMGLLWFVARGEWRSLAKVAMTVLALVALSALAAPSLWGDWVRFLLDQSGGSGSGGVLGTGSLGVRLVLAALLTLYGARTDRAWLLAPATCLASPLIGPATLTILAAIPRLSLSPIRRSEAPTRPLR